MRTRYCIVGGGTAAAAAIEGIRAHDKTGRILLLSRENHRPYHRPLLTKDLWYGTVSLERLPLHPDEWYAEQNVDVQLRHEIIELDADKHQLFDELGEDVLLRHMRIADEKIVPVAARHR